MKIFHGFGGIPLRLGPSALAIGNFDGVHLGHQKILGHLCRIAREKNLFSLVLTFSPHPEKALNQKPICLIQTLSQRLQAVGGFSPDGILVAGLAKKLAHLLPAEFAERVLGEKLRARDIVVGRDFRFGRNRQGDVASLKALGRKLGFAVHIVPPVLRKNEVVSSSLIRSLLKRGKVEDASRLLGRPYEIEGRVVRGRALGKGLGFPTANIRTSNEILPSGIFITGAVWRSKEYPSVSVIGTSPTFGVNHPLTVETFILDFDGDLYGETLLVRFLMKIRDEIEFSSPAALIRRICRDVEAARAYFRKRPGSNLHN